MRTLIILAMVGFAAFTAGWFKINREGDSTTIEINRAEIRSDTRRAIDKGRDLLDKREAEIAAREAELQAAGDLSSNGGYGDPSGQPYQDQRYQDQRYDNRYTDDPYRAERYNDDRYVPPATSDRYPTANSDDRYARPLETQRNEYGSRR